MATLVLEAVGSAMGKAASSVVSTFAGQAVNALGSLIGGGGGGHNYAIQTKTGPRHSSIAGLTSMEGAPIPRLYGRMRLGGQMIWASRFIEQTNYSYSYSQQGGGGGKSSGQRQTPVTTTMTVTYSYFANFAIGLCEGPISFVRRVWADGQELDLTLVAMRIYTGQSDQAPDPLIVAIEGADSAPAYRGLAYVVFERFPLEPFGDRVPQMTFEVVRSVSGIGARIQGVDLIPGASEFGYKPFLQMTFPGPGVTVQENRNQKWSPTDWIASIDALQALCPNLKSVALVVCWFGDDLRAGQCTIGPRVELASKMMWNGYNAGDWSVAGLVRAGTPVVSSYNGVASAGGTPSDDSVIMAIQDLKNRGLSVIFYPFVMMDIPHGVDKPNPWAPGATQPAYPWRGRITCDPAPGVPGSVDATAAAGDQIARFFGSDNPGLGEWSYRYFILHYVGLCAVAGGVDAFLVGSELVALTRVRSAPGVYPAPLALEKLARDVRAYLGPNVKISYSADWSEYGAHSLNGGSEVRFPLDPLWASPSVDFIGLDVYWPISDWRDGGGLDSQETDTIYDLDFLKKRFAAGEGYDWYYDSDVNRDAQIRSPITDGACSKPWVFRQKDIANWWSNAHFERVNKIEAAKPTAWVPKSKPFWFIETGCAAIDRGANAPNAFPDDKSSEGGVPYFSRGARDDLMQARYIDSCLSRYDPNHEGFNDADNPISSVYGARMVEPSRIHFWAWDARPFPAFPQLRTHWADADNWREGHWLNGRLESGELKDLLNAMLADDGAMAALEIENDVHGFFDGYVIDRTMSLRAAIEQLAALFSFDVAFTGGAIKFRARGRKPVITLGEDDLSPWPDGSLVRRTRQQESENPCELAITFCEPENDYASATVLSRRLSQGSVRRSETSTGLATRRGLAQAQAEVMLEDLWQGRETVEFRLPPTRQDIELGDIFTLTQNARLQSYLVVKVNDAEVKTIFARSYEASVFDKCAPDDETIKAIAPRFSGPAYVVALDLAWTPKDDGVTQYLAAYADPWTGPLNVLRRSGDAFEAFARIEAPATMGTTLTAFEPGPPCRWDRKNVLAIRLRNGSLSSVMDDVALEGATAMAIQGEDQEWEVFCFANAELIGAQTYKLTRLIRGLGGQDYLAERTIPAGAEVVLLDGALCPLSRGAESIGIERQYRIVNTVGAAASADCSNTPSDIVYKPYRPTHPRARKIAAGIEISFIRQTRIGGDAFETSEVQLGEANENYEVDIWLPGGRMRTLKTQTQSIVYADQDAVNDFGVSPRTLTLSLYQVSDVVGRGFALNAVISVD